MPGAGREVGRRIDQDEAAGAAVLGVAVEDERPRRRDRHRSDLVQHQRVIDFRRHRPRRVLQQVDARRIERPLVHPDHVGPEALADLRSRRSRCMSPRLMSISSSSVSVTDIGDARHVEIAVPGDDALDARWSGPTARP